MTLTVHRLTSHEQTHLHATGKTKCPVWDQFVVMDGLHYRRTNRGNVALYDSAEKAAATIKENQA